MIVLLMFCINSLISKPKLFMLIAYSELGLEGKTKLSRRQGTFYIRVIVGREFVVLEILVFKELNMVGRNPMCQMDIMGWTPSVTHEYVFVLLDNIKPH